LATKAVLFRDKVNFCLAGNHTSFSPYFLNKTSLVAEDYYKKTANLITLF